ncbi:hypothetical protein PENSPDRAFT_694669 [Peniophora sp. CONT]|nr:hypothetical protein PENSPDRAFT_694669 [Peniophora sp. CONT]
MPLSLNAPRPKTTVSRKRKAPADSTPRKRPLVTAQQQPGSGGGSDEEPAPQADKEPTPEEEEEELDEDSPIVLYDKDYFEHAGRIVGRTVDAWDNLTLIINSGVLGLIRKSNEPTTNLEKYRRRAGERLFKVLPGLVDLLTELEAQDDVDNDATNWIGEALDSGRKDTRSEDRGNFGNDAAFWIKDFQLPASRSERGFKHDGCGRYLCPVDLDWNDPHVKEQLVKEGALHNRYPRHLWPSGPDGYSENDYWGGFCRGELLVKGVTAILISRSLARGENRSTRHGNAKIFDVQYVDLPLIANVATLNHFTFHTQTHFTAGPGNIGEPITDSFRTKAKTEWPFRLFYYQLMHDLEVTMTSKDRDALLQWYNDQLFPQANGKDLAAEPEENDLRARMAAQAEERRRAQEGEAEGEAEA